jgi:predicted extracellular nuclease
VGTTVVVEGVVVGDFQGPAGLNGFYVQEEDGHADADPATSEGVFVFDSGLGVAVSPGDVVRVTGTVAEFNGLTEITAVTAVELVPAGGQTTPPVATRAAVTLPVTALTDYERLEGMAVEISQDLYISEFFNFDRFGEIVLTSERQFQPTALFEPGSAAASDLAAANALGRITLDDGRSAQNPDPAIHPNGSTFDLSNLFRSGDVVSGVTGVMDFAFGLYRIQPTQGADFAVANPRPSLPDVGGRLQVAGFNVLNYFTTIDTGAFICGPLADQECRGADNAEEFTRQRDKVISAISEIDADVVGAIEIENHPTDAATADLVAGLNDATSPGKYAYVATGAIGPDAIRVALLYQPGSVTPSGAYSVLDSDEFMDPNGLGRAQSRPALAQTFVENATGEKFTVVVNHLKSKGSECGPGDDDPIQGNCNLTRTLGARVLADWLATDPTGSGDDDFLVIGDLNSYDKEDPIDFLSAGSDDTAGTDDDFSDLLLSFEGERAYSYLFDGQLGYLDYALANQSLLAQVAGAEAWHINADEPDILDYDTQFKQPAQDALYEPNAYRSSDHDAVLVGLDLDQTPPVVEARFKRIVSVPKVGIFEVDYACVDNVDPGPTCVGEINGIPVDDGQLVMLVKAPGKPSHHRVGSVLHIKAPSFTLTVTGTDDAGNQATATAIPQF